MRRGGRLAAVVAVAVLLTGCAGEPEAQSPTFGGGDAGDTDLAALAAQADGIGVRGCPEPAAEPASGDDALPDLELVCLSDGEPHRLADIRGPAVVNLWASWCAPCREELPLLARLDDELGEQVQVVGIDVADKAPDAALDLAASSGVTYPQLFDPDQLTRAPLRVVGLPQTVFVDEQGIMVATERTPFRSYADLTDAVRRHLGVRP